MTQARRRRAKAREKNVVEAAPVAMSMSATMSAEAPEQLPTEISDVEYPVPQEMLDWEQENIPEPPPE
jgi:hypothetical protein